MLLSLLAISRRLMLTEEIGPKVIWKQTLLLAETLLSILFVPPDKKCILPLLEITVLPPLELCTSIIPTLRLTLKFPMVGTESTVDVNRVLSPLHTGLLILVGIFDIMYAITLFTELFLVRICLTNSPTVTLVLSLG